MVPFVAAFSASCSTIPSWAPRPATSDGSIAATVTRGATCAPALTTLDAVIASAAAAARTTAVLARSGVHRGEESDLLMTDRTGQNRFYDFVESSTCWNCLA